MLRKSLLGIAMVATVSVGAAAATVSLDTAATTAEPAANGALRNQTALAVAGRITPQMRAMAAQCAPVIGATRTPCTATGSSSLMAKGGGAAVAAVATAAVIWGGYEAFRKNNSNPVIPIST